MDEIKEPILPAGAMGWSFWRNDEQVGFAETKRSLLISKDMMALQGLAECERWMAERGWQILPTRIVVLNKTAFHYSERYFWGPTVDNKPHIGMIDWGIHKDGHQERAYHAIAFYLYCLRNDRQRAPELADQLSIDDLKTCRHFGCWSSLDYGDPTQPKDKRRRTTFARLRSATLKIFERLGIDAKPMRYEVVS